LELLAFLYIGCLYFRQRRLPAGRQGPVPGGRSYFNSLCSVCFLQNLQYLLNSILSLVFFLFFQEL